MTRGATRACHNTPHLTVWRGVWRHGTPLVAICGGLWRLSFKPWFNQRPRPHKAEEKVMGADYDAHAGIPIERILKEIRSWPDYRQYASHICDASPQVEEVLLDNRPRRGDWLHHRAELSV